VLWGDNLKISYEVHAQFKGHWSVVRIFDAASEDYALCAAHELYAEPHVTSVKVVRATYNPENNKTSLNVVHDIT
jgi:hypothetical protein